MRSRQVSFHPGVTDSVRSGIRILINCTNNKRLLGRLKAFDRHFNMVLEEVMWTEQHKKGRNRGRDELIHKDRFISKKFLRGDSVILVIKLRLETEGDDADYNVTGSEGTPRLELVSATMDQLDERMGETHLSHPIPRFNPRSRMQNYSSKRVTEP